MRAARGGTRSDGALQAGSRPGSTWRPSPPASRCSHLAPRGGAEVRAQRGWLAGTAMLDRLGLPRPQIATKLYGAIALTLAVVYLLAAATIQFAGRTEEAVGWIREDGAAARRARAGALEASLEQQRRLVAIGTLRLATHDASAARRARLQATGQRRSPRSCARMGYRHDAQASPKAFAALAQQGALAFGFARDAASRAGAAPRRPRYAAAARGAAARRSPPSASSRTRPRDAALDNIAAQLAHRSSPGCAPPPPSPAC